MFIFFFSVGSFLKIVAWFCIVCIIIKIYLFDDYYYLCYFYICIFKSYNFIGFCFKMSVVLEFLNVNSIVNYKYYIIIVKIVIYWWYGFKWYICWFYIFCILCLILVVVWLSLVWRSLLMLVIDFFLVFCLKKKNFKIWKIRI